MRLLLLLVVLSACSVPRENRALLEYDAHCPLHMEQQKDYYKVLPMREQYGKIIVYDDSVCFKSDNDTLRFVLRVLSFSGDHSMSRIVCLKEGGEHVLFTLSKQRFSRRYDAYILTSNGGHYFDISTVR